MHLVLLGSVCHRIGWSLTMINPIVPLFQIIMLLLLHETAGLSQSGPHANLSLVFVSGWPQSGTSLVQQIFTVTPSLSTMVKRCQEVLDRKKCVNWNNEGQWLLGQGPLTPADEEYRLLTNKSLMPGAMCLPTPEMVHMTSAGVKPREGLRNYILQQWLHFWNASQPVLVEKSPQFMLKIPLLQGLFQGARKLKFLVVIKHPATLNNAVPRLDGGVMDWMHHTKDGDGDPRLRTARNSEQQKLDNMRFFIDFLGHGTNSSEQNDALHWEKNRRTCSLGWIPAMEQLVGQLQAIPRDRLDLRVLRFESFERPSVVCRALFAFIYNEVADTALYDEAIKKVCYVHFALVKSASTSTAARGSLGGGGRHAPPRSIMPPGSGIGKHRRLLDEEGADPPRRILRLHIKDGTPSSQLIFREKTMARSIFERLQGYFKLYRDPAIPDALREDIAQLHLRLRRFGYRIQPDNYASPSLRERTLLDQWDLVLLHNRKAPTVSKI